jgi:hypothetical protein
MRIHAVTLPARQIAEVADAYRALGFRVRTTADEAEIHVGWTRLRFTADPGYVGAHHLALTIPTGTFDAARDWLRGPRSSRRTAATSSTGRARGTPAPSTSGGRTRRSSS